MDKIYLLGHIIAKADGKQTNEKWEKLEAYVVGKRCQTLDDLLSGLFDYWLANNSLSSTSQESDSQVDEEEKRIVESQNHVSQLEHQLDQLKDTVREKESEIESLRSTLNKEAEEKQLLSEKLDTLTENNTKLNDGIKKLSNQLSSLAENLISSADYIEISSLKQLSSEIVLRNMDMQIGQLLQEIGISSMSEIGIPFDNKVHKVVTIQETDDPSKNNIIAESLGRGYRRGEQCIREQEVIVYKYKGENK